MKVFTQSLKLATPQILGNSTSKIKCLCKFRLTKTFFSLKVANEYIFLKILQILSVVPTENLRFIFRL